MNSTRIIFAFLMLAAVCVMAETDERMLAVAVETGDFATVKALLAKNPKLANTVDLYGNPVLSRASVKGNLATVKLLIDNGADVNAVRKDSGSTALHQAAIYGTEEIVRLLVERGAGVNAASKRGDRPLNWALSGGRTNNAKYLLSKGASLNMKGHDPVNLLHAALASGVKGIVEMILKKEEKIDFLTARSDGSTLLHSAASGGLTGFIRDLMTKGLKPDTKNIYGKTPLHLAAGNGQQEAVQLFLKAGVNIDITTHDGRTPLHLARQWGKKDVVDLLIKKGAYAGPRKFPKLEGTYSGQKRPGTTPVVFAPGIISSDEYGIHSYPAFSPDFKEVYWSAYSRGNQFIYWMRLEKGRWTAPELAPFSGKYHDGNPAFSPDGKRLYFDSSRPLEKNGKTKDEDIWYLEKRGTGWSEPINAGPQINGKGDEKFVSITRGGTLYFKILRDLYRVRKVKGIYGKVESLTQFNTEAIEVGPFIDPDERFLIFESNRPGGYGGMDLYIAFRSPDDTWSQAINMGKPVNSNGHERFAGISPDGKYFFFERNNIYWLETSFIKALKPE
jgi:ankyrin repeat protein